MEKMLQCVSFHLFAIMGRKWKILILNIVQLKFNPPLKKSATMNPYFLLHP